ncbi:GNAT family N-acetyltransferase [Paeniglutamicibacter sp. MACA_103]|uniref:GNAT family N-acetyltransferase n=1 Tax=Paeniglutamicibacter sp. MACA_103 TaxID=3377337 RepID=UPI003895B466
MTAQLLPMPTKDMPAWLVSIKAEYVASRMEAGKSAAEANAAASKSFAHHFPKGKPREQHLVYNVVAEDAIVGYLWIGPQTDADAGKWWVWDVEIFESFQRRGYGRDAMLLAEHEAKSFGAVQLGLNVFGYNTGARKLYEALGYATTSIHMAKQL